VAATGAARRTQRPAKQAPVQQIDRDSVKGGSDAGCEVKLEQHGSDGDRKDERQGEGVVGQASVMAPSRITALARARVTGPSMAGAACGASSVALWLGRTAWASHDQTTALR
jgi:hypothetical protein